MTNANIFDELTWRGLVHQSTSGDVRELLGQPPATLYIGFDPSADSLHVGSLLQIMLLARMQKAGHRVIALIGGATGMIGDPSGKSEERNLLSIEQVEQNLAGIRRQLEKFIDFSPSPAQALMANNYDWTSSISWLDFLRTHGKRFSVNAMLEKDSVKTRLTERDQGISFTEFSYMLLQATDFLHLFETYGCRLQLGGSDQWGNITAGVDLVRRVHGERVFGVTSPLLTTSDGKKLGKTERGAVWLDAARTSPYSFYQYWIRTDDRDVGRMLRMLTTLGSSEIEQAEMEHAAHPERQGAQKLLAHELTTLVHGEQATREVQAASEALFGEDLRALPEKMLLDVMSEAPSKNLVRGDFQGTGRPVADVLAEIGLCGSKSAARNDIKGGGIYLNNVRVMDAGRTVSEADCMHGQYLVFRKGKKSFYLVKLA